MARTRMLWGLDPVKYIRAAPHTGWLDDAQVDGRPLVAEHGCLGRPLARTA